MDIIDYLKEHENKDMLRFLTCGSVDDGKSTLIGRMLYDSKMIFDDQLSAAESESKKYGTTGEKIDMALLVDGLQSEREQGITIDVAYRFFATENRKFIIADTPGHEQYTRNMVTGASTADVAIILIDARKGILTQTRRHSFIVSLLGIEHVIVAINKMDLVNFSQEVYSDISHAYGELAQELNIKNTYYIPVSALNGDNVVQPSEQMPWYEGETLLGLLGFSHRMTWVAAPLALVIILLALQFTSRTQWSVRPADFIPMTIECILLAVPLVVLSILLNRPASAPTEAAWDIGQFPQTVYLAAEPANAPADNNTSRPADALLRTDGTVPGLMPNIVTGIGAGIYEELIFRLILIYLLMFFFQDLLKFSKAHSLVLSVLIAAILFSAHHHIFYIYGQLRSGEPFTMVKFIFRTLAGIYFAALFAIRGFAVTAGAHVFYNIIAAVLNSIGSA